MNKRSWILRAGGVCLLWAAAAVALPAQRPAGAPPAPTFTTLHSFDGTDGNGPSAGLVQGTSGHLYGTTGNGGTNNAGTVFEMPPSGVLASLYSFCARRNCADGASLYAGLVQDTRGTFYGTTALGGAKGAGTVFKITPNGRLRRLHSFDVSDGLEPLAGLVQATNGDFYGTTSSGGLGTGTVFKITPNGTLTTLHNFASREGEFPYAGLIQGTNGNLYGTTAEGGALNNGTVFTVTLDGALTTLYSFCSQSNCSDGFDPQAALVQAADGNLYGTTYEGGANTACPYQAGCGTVFKITPNGTLTTLHRFDGTDGAFPNALAQATDGDLYGTTAFGGPNSGGTLFRITRTGTLTTFYYFCAQGGSNCTDGEQPSAGALVQDTNGRFYGTTAFGGASGDGTVFSLSVGLGPFVRTLPISGEVGKAVEILGTNLTDATSVTFNGTAAMFTVKSKSEITTTVPAGATTGKVRVTFPHGTRSSNVPFRVE